MIGYENTEGKKVVGSWDQWAIHVIETLRSCEQSNKDLMLKMDQFTQDFIIHKTKVETRSAFVGSVAGLLASAVVSLVLFFLTRS